jgi:predicted phage terminase large subunit-like protein
LAEYARAIDIPMAPPSDDDYENEVFKPVETTLAAHHILFCDEVQACLEKPMGRLIIQAPPGSAKTSYVSVVAPPWIMGKIPGYRVILASYSSDQAVKPSRRARSICRQRKHTSIFPDGGLNEERSAAIEWKLNNGSEFMAGGFQSGITGNRADALLVDDPVKNRQDADSPTVRETTENEFRESAKTRLKPGASIIIVMTRWNEADLVGSILPEDYAGESGDILCRDGQVWRVVNMPAKSEHADDPLGRPIGTYLWPEWFPEAHWHQWERDPRAARTWSALFQQRPSPEKGLQFQRDMFRWYEPDRKDLPPPGTVGYGTMDKPCGAPKVLRLYGASDYATTDDGGDFTEHAVAGLDHLANLCFVDWWSGQRETDVSIAAFVNLVMMHRRHKLSAYPVVKWWNEGGPIDKAIKPAINRAMREAPNGEGFITCEAMPSIKDKAIKLLSFHARVSAHTVYLPVPRPGRMWPQAVVDQLIGFPAGRYDDKADVCGLLGRGIDAMLEGALPSADERKPGLKPFTQEWLEYSEPKAPKVRYWT